MMMQPNADTERFSRALKTSAGFVLALWFIKCIEWWVDFEFRRFGVFPRDIDHLAGIIFAPLIHGSFEHLVANTPPLVVLGTGLLYGYPRAAKIVIPVIWFGSGLGVWLFARSSFHIGASGLTFGMMFFVFTVGALRWDRRAIALSLLVFFLYGGMIWGIFPGKPGISFETHFFGAVIGVLGAVFLRELDPPPPVKRYSWELEPEQDDEDPYWLGEDQNKD